MSIEQPSNIKTMVILGLQVFEYPDLKITTSDDSRLEDGEEDVDKEGFTLH